MKKAMYIMVQGTMSGAGKSLLCAALCRIFKQDGYKVAPFKSQNMALNSYITRDGMEMGRAQVVQAHAAGIEPDVRMNPILLKPSSDTGSQVIVMGEVWKQMDAKTYYTQKGVLLPEAIKAFRSLEEEFDIIVIEGAGSPAEINLRENDIVNMGFAEAVDAPVLLAGDIDRGGVFAQLYGTVALLKPEEQARIIGLIVNKFRGDVTILEPGLRMLEDLAKIPVAGAVPYTQVDIDDEDSLSPRLQNREATAPIDIAVISLPRISNFTDFTPLEAHPALGVRYVRTVEEMKRPDLVILPGTKSTMSDLKWLRESGLETVIQKLANDGVPVLGVCGGYQMLGNMIYDPELVEGVITQMRGMELLPIETTFEGEKTRTRVQGEFIAGPLAGAKLDAYEIHMGITKVDGENFAKFADLDGSNERIDGCVTDHVWGTYLHGLFDTGETTAKLANYLAQKKGLDITDMKPIAHDVYENKQYDILADAVRNSLDMEAIYKAMREYQTHE